jgi:hypothetical protein
MFKTIAICLFAAATHATELPANAQPILGQIPDVFASTCAKPGACGKAF